MTRPGRPDLSAREARSLVILLVVLTVATILGAVLVGALS